MDDRARLLIADDEELFLLSTADLLRQEGYLVDCASARLQLPGMRMSEISRS
jgi:CheY-like chemotaxis protein